MTYEEKQQKFQDQLLVILKEDIVLADKHIVFINWGDKQRPTINQKFIDELPAGLQGSVQSLIDDFEI